MKSQEVLSYLQDNPQFFEEHAELLSHIPIPHPHGGRTISITERQMLSLREKNRKLENKLGELLRFGEDNDALSDKVHRLAVAMISAATLQAVLHSLNFYLRDDFGVPYFALRFWERPDAIAELPAFAGVDGELRAFAETLTQPYCGAASADASAWFGEDAVNIRSQALLALRSGGSAIGLLALGSEDGEHFYEGMGTLYLERIGELLSAALVRVQRFA